MSGSAYRGRLAPSPTGDLHLGHACTFAAAWRRAREAGGALLFRVEDLDPQRCRPHWVQAQMEDLRWLGIDWDEGPDVGGPAGPYVQSERRALHLAAWERLRAAGVIYPCRHSRRDVAAAAGAPHHEGEEPVFPPAWRAPAGVHPAERPEGVNWRFRVPDGEVVHFVDGRLGRQYFTAGVDFGDFLVWRHDGVPAYQLAVVVDDAAMGVTEVVRGLDLLVSTARQDLLARALGCPRPACWHAPLVRDEHGQRLAKRDAARGLAAARAAGAGPAAVWDEIDRHLGPGRRPRA